MLLHDLIPLFSTFNPIELAEARLELEVRYVEASCESGLLARCCCRRESDKVRNTVSVRLRVQDALAAKG
jgi:hypothetical protein